MRMHKKNGYVLGAAMVAAAAGVGTLIYKTVNKKSNDNEFEDKDGTIEIEELEDLPGNGEIYGNFNKVDNMNTFTNTSTNTSTTTNTFSDINYGEDNQMKNNINIDQNVSKSFQEEAKKDRDDLTNLWKRDFDATLKGAPKNPEKDSNTLGTNNAFTNTADLNTTTVNSSPTLSYTVGEAMHDAFNNSVNSNNDNDYSFNKKNAEAIKNYYDQYKRN
ncbi:hypothetical protein JOC70_002635 [Clostridium pascui]|uniref:hypothetical protein n=1 Tax=Clostridium pascui TaxID=46609 RepID=UPI00195A84FC|nr:hypothetical protein [Clostridium pascui]MBM7871137.1 hypothetical protein [Clostridium pascui]